MTVISRLRVSTRMALLAVVALLGGLATVVASPVSATVQSATYTGTQPITVPPASSFTGGSGGDGWALAFTTTRVFNVYHHSGALIVDCHVQATAAPCWDDYNEPRIVQNSGLDANNNPVDPNFSTAGQVGQWLDPTSRKLYVVAHRNYDASGGVVCVDTDLALTTQNPFCGFTQLTGPGSANDGLSNIAVVGTKLYSFNYVDGQPSGSGVNQLLCFDTTTDAACAGQPYDLGLTGTIYGSNYPTPGTVAIGGRVYIPLGNDTNDGNGSQSKIACFDPAVVGGACSGSWPVTEPSTSPYYPNVYGSPFPMLSTTGTVTGLCLPDGVETCFALNGSVVTPPQSLTDTMGYTSIFGGGWNGPAAVIGTRVYIVSADTNQVRCYDYNTAASCANFPYVLQNIVYPYTVTLDPQRPSCLWVNGDSGGSQIQNFDAFSAQGCGEGPLRILSSQFINSAPACSPLGYLSLQITSPAPADYTSATVAIRDSAGNVIPGVTDKTLDSTGTVDLSTLGLTGFPQFLITFNGLTTAPSTVTAVLKWTANYDATCTDANTTAVPDSTPSPDATSLVYDGATSGEYSDSVTLSATLTDTTTNTKIQGATVSFSVGGVSVGTGTTNASGVATKTYTLPDSTPLAVVASYAGDSSHASASDSSKSITVSPDDCTLAYTGDAQVAPLANTNLAAQMTDPAGSPGDFSGHTVTFTVKNSLGTTVASPTALTNSAGAASVSVPLNADAYSVDVADDGNSKYAVCTPPATTLFTVAAAGSKVTGGGWSSNSTGRISFGFNLVPQAGGAWTSEVQIRSNSNKNDFHGRGVNTVTQLSAHSVRWTGSGTWNGKTAATFSITVTDGKPDTVNITITSGGAQVLSTGGAVALKGGNLAVH